MSDLRVEPMESTLGAIVSGIQLNELDAFDALDDPDWRAIEAAFHQHALLIFPGQHLKPLEQVSFAQRFGEIEHLFGESGYVPISNQRRDGSLLADDEPPMQVMHGNEGWHTDSSYMPLSAKASVLSAHVVPPKGGQTEWADMRAAYAALDDATRARIGELSAYHSIKYSQGRLGYTDPAQGYGFQVDEAPLRPLVKTHPVTGVPALYIGRHAHAIPGLDPVESEKLLSELLAFACQAPRTYQHEWRPGDLVIWDNRCLLHRARPYDHSQPRVMVHTRIAGDPKTELAD